MDVRPKDTWTMVNKSWTRHLCITYRMNGFGTAMNRKRLMRLDESKQYYWYRRENILQMPMKYYRYGSYSSTALKMSTHRLSTLLLASKELTNPHTHEGCDPTWIVFARFEGGFNPHTHEGCDRITFKIMVQRYIIMVICEMRYLTISYCAKLRKIKLLYWFSEPANAPAIMYHFLFAHLNNKGIIHIKWGFNPHHFYTSVLIPVEMIKPNTV